MRQSSPKLQATGFPGEGPPSNLERRAAVAGADLRLLTIWLLLPGRPVILGLLSIIMGNFGYRGLVFWATWISRQPGINSGPVEGR